METRFVVFVQADLVRRFSFLELYQEGIVCTWARSRQEVEDKLAGLYETVVIDLNLQHEEGLELCRKLKALPKPPKIVLIQEEMRPLAGAPADVILPHHVGREALVEVLRRL